jgi:hypothetical protein
MLKHFGLVDTSNNEIVGVITNITLNEVGVDSLNERIAKAVGDYFDINEDGFNIDIVDFSDVRSYKPKEISIEVDGLNYFVELQEIFLY